MKSRLNFIYEIQPIGIQLKKEIRSLFIMTDEMLIQLGKNPSFPLDVESKRTLELARTHLEISLQFTIKTLCLQFEKKDE